MDRVGGYAGYLALLGDATAFEDVLIVMAGESEASAIREAERKAGHGR